MEITYKRGVWVSTSPSIFIKLAYNTTRGTTCAMEILLEAFVYFDKK
jgi:hypothetical protein